MNRHERFEHGLASQNFEFQAVRSPFDGRVLAEVQTISEAEAFALVTRMNIVLNGNSAILSAVKRREILLGAALELEASIDSFAKLIAEEGGKPLKDAKVEATRAASTLRIAAQEAGFAHGEHIPMQGTSGSAGRLAVTVREPIGVVFAISAFNHPLNLIAHQVGSALAAGCPVIVKPASETPLSCIRLIELLRNHGLPKDCAQWIMCTNDVAQKIAESSRIAFLSFIGSARVGWHLHSRVAPGTRVSLEHGGAAPVIIDESADIDAAIPVLIRGGYYHSGQVCVSVQRIFVAEKRAEEFAAKFLSAVGKLKTGDAVLEDTDCGPIIRTRDVERIMSWIKEAVDAGAKLAAGGKQLSPSLIAPTVLLDAPVSAKVMTEEIFGPVVVINKIKSLEEGIAAANSLPYIFQSAIFTGNFDSAMKAARELRATTVLVNDSTTFRADWMPFAGGGVSGLGVGGVPYSVREMTREKMIVLKSAAWVE